MNDVSKESAVPILRVTLLGMHRLEYGGKKLRHNVVIIYQLAKRRSGTKKNFIGYWLRKHFHRCDEV
jgi:hypothetical protein